jgi:hypothetical protein
MTVGISRFRQGLARLVSGSAPGVRHLEEHPSDHDQGVPMKYAMFIVMDPEATEADDAAAPPIEGWFDYMIGKGAYLQGIRLQPKSDATTVRVRDGKVLITDGPFTESKEWIAGVAVIDVEDLDEAIEQALKHNMAYQGRLEIRPIHSIGGPQDR